MESALKFKSRSFYRALKKSESSDTLIFSSRLLSFNVLPLYSLFCVRKWLLSIEFWPIAVQLGERGGYNYCQNKKLPVRQGARLFRSVYPKCIKRHPCSIESGMGGWMNTVALTSVQRRLLLSSETLYFPRECSRGLTRAFSLAKPEEQNCEKAAVVHWVTKYFRTKLTHSQFGRPTKPSYAN
uniref:Uncharacterized protein n=1 Tax=Vespula pensylvanica TaxID=30213 RepID=A0A834UAE0_VESPE|nr:hypothetical protein H0235_008029 [Vespula pensylvanica]